MNTKESSNNSRPPLTKRQFETRKEKSDGTDGPPKLTRLQILLAAFVLVLWFFLFAGGISMDTSKFRCAISPGGATALAAEARPGQTVSVESVCKDQDFWVPAWPVKLSEQSAAAYKLGISWLGLLLFFLPLNLAMIACAAGALGAFGNRANLEHEQARILAWDDSNPVMSGLLRGLFVYLFFISGLLLFDDKPFSSPGPGQYIRLAGFLSLISFLVNYRPNLFSTISDWAFERINARKVVPSEPKEKITAKKTTEVKEEIEVKIPMPDTAANGADGAVAAQADAAGTK